MIKSFAHAVIRWRIAILFVLVVLVVFAGSGVRFLTLNNDFRMFFSEADPHLQAFEEMEETYTKNNNVLFIVTPRGGDVFTQEALTTIELLTDEAWQTPYSSRVDSVTNFQHSVAKDGHLHVDALVRDAPTLTPEAIENIRRVALNEPLLVNRLISAAGDVAGVNVTIQLPAVDEANEVLEVANFSRELAAKFRDQNTDLHVTGLVMMNAAFSESSEQDITTLIPLMLLLITVIMALLLRSLWGTVISLVSIFIAIAVALGLAGWMGVALSPTSAIAPNIILTVVVAYCVHILRGVQQSYRDGKSRHEAIVETICNNAAPLFLASLTTIIGFLSMNTSDVPPFHDLGNITAVGVGTAFVLAMVFLPATLSLLPIRPASTRDPLTWMMSRLASFVIEWRNALFWGMLAFIVLVVAWIPNNRLNDEYVKYWDESVEFRQATDYATEHLTGIYYLDYSLQSDGPGGVSAPEFLARVEAFSDWFKEQSEVLHVNSVVDVYKKINQNMHDDDPAEYRLPAEQSAAAQYLLLYEMSLPYGLDLNDRIDIDKTATRLSAVLHSVSSTQVLDLERRAQAWLSEHAPGAQSQGTGLTVMFAHIGQRNIRTMLVSVTTALVLVSLVLMIAFKSVKFGLVSLVPNLVPVAMGFGIWGLFVGQIGLALSVVAAMTLGIVIDDTVHFLSKYLKARRAKATPEEAVRHAFVTTGSAIWVTSLVLIVGFGVLAFSTFEVNSGMGLLTSVVIALALVADFLFLPALLLKMEERRDEKVVSVQPTGGSSVTPA